MINVDTNRPATPTDISDDAKLSVERLGQFNVDVKKTTVSGISSGGFMASQMHVAHSDIVQGAGIFAGGPYGGAYSAGAGITGALTCMEGTCSVDMSRGYAHLNANLGLIDALDNLKDDKVWLFQGTKDETVKPDPSLFSRFSPFHDASMNSAYRFYEGMMDANQIFYKDNLPAGHAHITDDFGNACDANAPNFINDCDYDGAGQLLQHLYGALNPRQEGALSGRLIAFDQSLFTAGKDPSEIGMGEVGYAYIPQSVLAGEPAKIHVAFHGCRQSDDFIGDAYIRNGGYNEWADTNNMIVLYPQARKIPLDRAAADLNPSDYNPKGCWDWWGYTGADYATKESAQMSTIRRMIDHLGGNFNGQSGPDTTRTELTLLSDSSDDAVSLAWGAVAQADHYNVYREGAGGEWEQLNDKPLKSGSFVDSDGLFSSAIYNYRVEAVDAAGEVLTEQALTVATAAAPQR